MAYNTKSIVKDVNGKPVPQYWNKLTQQYEVITSTGGKIRNVIVDSDGNDIEIKEPLGKIIKVLDDILKVVT